MTAIAHNVTGGYEMTMFIPWELFEHSFRPRPTVVGTVVAGCVL